MTADRAVTRARTRLVLSQPFLGTLCLQLAPTPVEARWCPRIATDGRRLYFRPSWVAEQSEETIAFCLAHTVLHLALGHPGRRGHRRRRRWDAACDHAVNALLTAPEQAGGMGLRAPRGIRGRPEFAGLAAEQIYPLLSEQPGGMRLDAHPWTADPGQEGDEFLCEFDAAGWRRRVVRAAVATRLKLRGTLPAWLQREIERQLEPQLPWHELLARYLHRRIASDYTLLPPNRRFLHLGIYLPSASSPHLDAVVAIDTSGSISAGELARFAGELNGVLLAVRSYRVELLACDAAVTDHHTVHSPDQLALRTLAGGGGTDFRPVFERVRTEGWRPGCLIYLTDGYGEFPDLPPGYPVLWVLTTDVQPPFGTAIRMPEPLGEQ